MHRTGTVAGKEASWAYCVAYLQAKFRLRVLLLVVCQDGPTAKWAAGPFDCGTRGWTALRVYPLVAGPDNLPVITDARTAAKNLAPAVLSALAHARNPDCDAVPDTAEYFFDFLEVTLGKTPAGEKWNRIMSFVSYFPGQGTVRETAYLKARRKEGRKARPRGSSPCWRCAASP
ncbi:Transposase (putative) YhgA-like domain-containing protein OS=Streptomyces canus OX=58343 GN=AQJ46_07990 PE=4 SV=1 [Streptomyces canus]